MNVAVQGAFSQPFGDCVAAEVEMLAQYYADLAQCAALEQRCYARVVELLNAHPGAACVRDLPYDEVKRAMTDAEMRKRDEKRRSSLIVCGR